MLLCPRCRLFDIAKQKVHSRVFGNNKPSLPKIAHYLWDNVKIGNQRTNLDEFDYMYYALHCPFLNTVKKFSRLGALNLPYLEADKNFSTFPLFRQKIALSSRSLTAGMVLTFLFWKRCRIRLIRCKESHNSWVAYQLSQNPNFKCPSVKLFRHFIKTVSIALVNYMCFVN